MMSKKVSVIIPCYNQAKYVSDAINSALNQTYSNIEIVIINDGSTDNSSEVINKFANQYDNILFLDEKENKGVILSRNKAIEMSTGEYILPLDADDTIEPTYVEKAVKILDEMPQVGIVYCKANLFGAENTHWWLPEFDKDTIIFVNCIFCSAMYRKTDFYKAGKYKEYMEYGCEDWDLWLSFIELGLEAYRIDEILFNYRQYEENSRNKESNKNYENVCSIILSKHPNLYANSKKYIKKVFDIGVNETFQKYQKYKNLFKILLSIACLETIVIILLTLSIFIK